MNINIYWEWEILSKEDTKHGKWVIDNSSDYQKNGTF